MTHLFRQLGSITAVFALLGVLACGEDTTEPEDRTPDAAAPKPEPEPDAKVPTPKPDAKTEPAPEVSLESLAGTYLLRFDTFGTTKQGTLLEIKSRASQLWVAELKVDGDKLTASEKLCSQVSKQRCVKGCMAASTVVDEQALTEFAQKRTFERSYTLAEDGTLTGEKSVALLGYDDPADGDLPTDSTDPRVWDVVAGGEREGLLTNVSIKVLTDVNCTVFGAQRLVSQFSGVLQGTPSKPVFPSMDLELGGSGGETLGTMGGTICNQASEAESPVERATARLVRYDSGSALDCGDLSDFDELLPPEEP